MSYVLPRVLAVAGVISVLLVTGATAWSQGDPGIAAICALPEMLRIKVDGIGTTCAIIELRPYEEYAADADHAPVWQGVPSQGWLTIPRLADKRDRLYSKFQLIEPGTGEALGDPRFVDDLDGIGAWDFDMPWPKSIKGVTCPVDVDDLIALGVKYTDTNVMLPSLIDWRSDAPQETWEVDGQKIGINLSYVRHFDEQIKRMNEAGINVTLILLNGIPQAPEPGNPLLNPRSDLARAPMHLGAFNVTDEQGLLHYRAAMEYLAHRYSDPSGKHGWVSGYVIGNELQAHWVWHNTGRIALEDLARDYSRQLRIAWLATRRFHSKVRVYASMEHHWTTRHDADPLKAVRGDRLLEELNSIGKAGGDFGWHLAFHPYPENLGNPRFWEDKTAALGFDTPRITFKNLEVLPAYLGQERFLYKGNPRRVLLSEQGLHCPGGPEGERVQAAAYAYAYHKISHMPQIDAFILHRHVDHRGEGGLRLGLWTCKQDGPNPCAPERKRLIWDVFRLADTDDWEKAFEFAKPIIGIDSWDETLPYEGAIPADSKAFAEPIAPSALIYNLQERMSEAKMDNCLDCRRDWAMGPDGRQYPTIFQHPPEPAKGVGTLRYTINLPPLREGNRVVLQFGTTLLAASDDGVEFSILVDDKTVWQGRQTQAETPADHQVDLSDHAGGAIELELRVDALGNAGHDWAHWLRPVVLFAPENSQ